MLRGLGVAAVLSLPILQATAAQAEGLPSAGLTPAVLAAPFGAVDAAVVPTCKGTCRVTCDTGAVYNFSVPEWQCCSLAAQTCNYFSATWTPGYGPSCAGQFGSICQ